MSATPLSARVMGRIRRMAPDRVVERDVQGVRLRLPWSHRLPDYARTFPEYGQNLVALARELAVTDPDLVVVDVGANVGDSALQILQAVPSARVVCVEGDEYWLRFLRMNVGTDSRVTIVPALVVDDAQAADVSSSAMPGVADGSGLVAVRDKGTTRFVAGSAGSIRQLGGRELRIVAGVDSVRLVKSDTDGYDTRIVPTIAAAWRDSRPVILLEYDPRLTRLVGDEEPADVWRRLGDLGYADAVVWGNTGELIGAMSLAELAVRSAEIDRLPEGDDRYWDVALARGDDVDGRAALTRVVEGSAS